ncbi:MAG TPA: ABC transporter substrate-binding protein [Stellaceae bacterium]|nr:ABC transporter substrate-binding protein [Stellaceae bacterium]
MPIKSSVVVAVMATAFALSASTHPASAQNIPPGYPDSYKDIVAAAMKEGKVTILSSTNSPNTKPVWADFEKLYPGIKVEQSDLSSTELYNRFLSQEAAGDHETDVLWSNAMDLQMKLVMDGRALTYVSPEKSHMPSWAQYKDQIYALTLDPTVFVYNKRLLPPALVPKTHADILKLVTDHRDAYQGKVTTYDVATTGSAYLTAVYDSKQWPQYWDLVNAFGKIGARYYQSAGAMVEMVAAGQYAFAYDLPYPYAQFREMTDPNVGHVFPSDYTLSLSRVVLISKNTPHPNAAKLFLDYLLSKRGQQLIADKGALVAIRSDVTGPNSFTEVVKQAGPNFVPAKLDPSLLDSLQPRPRLEFLRKWKSGANGS